MDTLTIGKATVPARLPIIPRMGRIIDAQRRAAGLQFTPSGDVVVDEDGAPIIGRPDPDAWAVVCAAALALCWRGADLDLPGLHEVETVEAWGDLALASLIRLGHDPADIYAAGRGCIDAFHAAMPKGPPAQEVDEHADFSEADPGNGPSPASGSANNDSAIRFDGST